MKYRDHTKSDGTYEIELEYLTRIWAANVWTDGFLNGVVRYLMKFVARF